MIDDTALKVNSAKLGIDTPHIMRSSTLPIFKMDVLQVQKLSYTLLGSKICYLSFNILSCWLIPTREKERPQKQNVFGLILSSWLKSQLLKRQSWKSDYFFLLFCFVFWRLLINIITAVSQNYHYIPLYLWKPLTLSKSYSGKRNASEKLKGNQVANNLAGLPLSYYQQLRLWFH